MRRVRAHMLRLPGSCSPGHRLAARLASAACPRHTGFWAAHGHPGQCRNPGVCWAAYGCCASREPEPHGVKASSWCPGGHMGKVATSIRG